MKVVLTQDVKAQGKKGQLIEVSDGYARNFLLPRKLAVIADNAALNEKPQKTLAHNRVGDIHSAEFTLLRSVLKFAVFDYPVVEWAVIAEL